LYALFVLIKDINSVRDRLANKEEDFGKNRGRRFTER
jgi:hypothetical protein